MDHRLALWRVSCRRATTHGLRWWELVLEDFGGEPVVVEPAMVQVGSGEAVWWVQAVDEDVRPCGNDNKPNATNL